MRAGAYHLFVPTAAVGWAYKHQAFVIGLHLETMAHQGCAQAQGQAGQPRPHMAAIRGQNAQHWLTGCIHPKVRDRLVYHRLHNAQPMFGPAVTQRLMLDQRHRIGPVRGQHIGHRA